VKDIFNILDLIEVTLSSDDIRQSDMFDELQELQIYYLDEVFKVLLQKIDDVNKPNFEFANLAIEVLRRVNRYSKLYAEPLIIEFDEIEKKGLDDDLFKSNRSDKYELLKQVKGIEVANDIFKKSMFLHISKKYERYITASFDAFMNNTIDVAYTLLRMPYFDLQFYIERFVCEPDELLGDILNKNPMEYDYISRYKRDDKKKSKIRQVISDSFKCVHKIDMDDKLLDDMYALRFDNESDMSMLNIIQKSNHLITTSPTGASGISELNFAFLGDEEVVRPLADYYLVLACNILRTSITYIYYVFRNTIALKEGIKRGKISEFLVGMTKQLRNQFIENGATEEDINTMLQELESREESEETKRNM